MKKYAVIVAGGTGLRMGSVLPKQFLLINGKPVLYYTIQAFLKAYEDIQIILVLPIDFIENGNEIISAYFNSEKIKITTGGDTRFQSVKNGLQLIEEDSIIFVHDGVRCVTSIDLIKRCYEEALVTGTAIPVVKSRDSIRVIDEEGVNSLDRSKVMLVQTPQTFHSKILLPAFQIDYKSRFTDEATVVEAYGIKLTMVDGDEENIKITHLMDLWFAEQILLKREG